MAWQKPSAPSTAMSSTDLMPSRAARSKALSISLRPLPEALVSGCNHRIVDERDFSRSDVSELRAERRGRIALPTVGQQIARQVHSHTRREAIGLCSMEAADE